MSGAELGMAVASLVLHEAMLFAACGFLLLGASDLLVDLIWIGRSVRWRLAPYERVSAETIRPAEQSGLIAVFIPAWDESAVLGDMLRATLSRFGDRDYRLYIGCYPNDPATIEVVRDFAEPRIRLVLNERAGPTTKADCLNRLWQALLRDEVEDGRIAKAIVLHDAEDVVHSAELPVFDYLIERFDLVQLPVLPIVDGRTTWVSATYADEFAESHGKELVVREAIGASIPSAGVGCAFSRRALAEAAARHGGAPFEADSLTEDYELGIRLHAAGHRAAFVRLPQSAGGPVVATREYFPGTVTAAVSQKARWITGIALSGWDRLGWTRSAAETWMRLRDRQSVLAALILFVAYLAFLLWLGMQIAAIAVQIEPLPLAPMLSSLLTINLALLVWRLALRAGFVAQAYGWRQAFWSVPRVVVGNFIAMLAAREAVGRYLRIRRTGAVRWDKTVHIFPAELPAE